MTKTIHKCYLLIIGLMAAVTLASCSSEELPAVMEQHAIVFASEEANEQSVMLKGATPLNNNFTVWGYKTLPSGTQMVFNQYSVTYAAGTANTTETNTHDYEYVSGGQTIKYWDFGASAYRFWGATGGSWTTDGTQLTISGLQQSTTEPAGVVLFSELYQRSPVSGEVVQLKFRHPYTKVRIMFYTGDQISSEDFDNIDIKGITLAPASGTIPTAGKLMVNYSKTGERETFGIDATTSAANLAFGNVSLSDGHGTASNNAVSAVPVGGTEYYYVLPNDKDVNRAFVLRATIDGEPKTATIPAAYMNWQPNYSYTYIFKISGGNRIEIFDVKIDPWKFGGEQEEEWKNW